ncbi:MAG: aspartyl protease family protein [Planctomycetota bacterium]|nr:aspartyl protease family protein [Planctomycetota bacterium]
MSRQCPSCDSYNDADALHCNQCGSPLVAGGGAARNSPAVFSGWVLVLLVVVGLVLFRWEGPADRTSTPDGSGSRGPLESEQPLEDGSVLITDLVDLDSLPSGGESSAGEPGVPLLWGWVDVEDPMGLSLSKIPGVVTSDGWLAIPRVSLLGAEQVLFRRGLAGESLVVEGSFRKGDDLSLWRIEKSPDIASAPLAPWDPDRPVSRIVATGRRHSWSPTGPMTRIGFFLRGSVRDSAPSVLVQDEAIVGWIPGEHFPGAWFWVGSDAQQLAGASLREFQLAEFEGGQIATARILLDPDVDDLIALDGLARAIGRPRLLTEGEIPRPYHKQKLARATLDRLKSGLASASPGAYFDILTLDVFIWLETPPLCGLWLSLALKAGDESRLARAVQVGDVILGEFGESDLWQDSVQLLPFLWRAGAELYRSGGALTVAANWIVEGRKRFPADDALRLLDAERLLDAGQLDASEELLAIPVARADLKAFRQGLIERLELARRIAGRILIRFAPGSTVIRATALVGGVPIDFVVDTGASATSIPPSALVALGIHVDENTPRRRVRTASDEFEAPTVALPRVDLEGAVIDGMMATVLDLPGQPDTGLLGMDFLGKFRIDLDVERGWLLLEPR